MSVNQVERAYRAWPILTGCAMKGTTITYGDLAQSLGIHHRAVRYVLGVIQDYCLSEHLPPLTIVVVSQNKGMPGHGFIAWDIDDLQTGLAKVYGYNWDALENPFSYASDGSTADDLVEVLVSQPEKAGEVFSRVKVRGSAQMLFRKTLLRVYQGQCAFCGLTFEDVLEASHIIPWADASPRQRLDPSNGILLCSIHHKLFDAGLMTISKSGKIVYADPQGEDGPYSASDQAMTLKLHDKPVFLPLSATHRPSAESLAIHHERHEWGELP
jgi:putative restriction endonuclease